SMSNAYLSIAVNDLLEKLNDPDKIDRTLRQLSKMGLPLNLLQDTKADKVLESLFSHPIHGRRAQSIVRRWRSDGASTPSTPSSGPTK
ncbi:hypothetical protein PFISCL1PPCAC_21039, partial [Pristionchus fissidentatus]